MTDPSFEGSVTRFVLWADAGTMTTTETPCPICAYANIHHSWGDSTAPGRSHCHDCHRTWGSLVEGHCAVCHRHFANYTAFDAHFVEDEHADPATVMRQDGRPRFTSRTSVFGLTWRIAFYGSRPDFGGDSDDESTDDEHLDIEHLEVDADEDGANNEDAAALVGSEV